MTGKKKATVLFKISPLRGVLARARAHAHRGDASCTVKANHCLQCVTSVIVLIRHRHRLSPVTFIAHLNILPRQMVRMSRRDTELLSPSPLRLRHNAGLVSSRLF